MEDKKQENEQHVLTRIIYETSPIAKYVKEQKELGVQNKDIAQNITAIFPAKQIADDVVNDVEVISGLEKIAREAKTDSDTDPLTSLPNRRRLDDEVNRELKILNTKKQKTMMRFSYILLDADYFKRINDEIGHDAGDYVLQTIGGILKNIPDCFSARYGGEEFVVLARNYPEQPSHLSAARATSEQLQTGEKIAEKIRTAIEEYNFIYKKGQDEIPIKMTASFGVAGYKEGDTARDIFIRADSALDRAKKEGRNKTIVNSIHDIKYEHAKESRLKQAWDVLRGKRYLR